MKDRNIVTRGFVTRKMARLIENREVLERTLKYMDAEILRLLREATRLTTRKGYCIRNLNRCKRDLTKLKPRLKCEEVKTIYLVNPKAPKKKN